MNIVRSISQDHDVEVQIWCDELTPLIDKPTVSMSCTNRDLFRLSLQ